MSLTSTGIESFIDTLGVTLPPIESFDTLYDLTGLRSDSQGRFYRANFERGLLLYALVRAYQPKVVLEYGTGRGYGCLCAAWALVEGEIDGYVYTIDRIPSDQRQVWAIRDAAGARLEQLSTLDVWPRAAPASWLARINLITGYSGRSMQTYAGPPVELAFIDGGHGYAAVRHDFYAAVRNAGSRFGILFDDYAPLPGFGVKKLIDEEITPYFDARLIFTDGCWPQPKQYPTHGMVWIHSDSQTEPIDSLNAQMHKVLRFYRYTERALIWQERAAKLLKKMRF